MYNKDFMVCNAKSVRSTSETVHNLASKKFRVCSRFRLKLNANVC